MTDTDPFQWVTDPTTTHEAPEANQRTDAICHYVTDHDDRPDELVFVPRDPEDDVVTTWITIDADAALDLRYWR